MSKRKSKKIKRALRAQAQRQNPTQSSAQGAYEPKVVLQNTGEEVVPPTEEIKTEPKAGFIVDPEEQVHARREIKKILLTILALAIVIVGIYLVNIKTDFILKIGQTIGDKLGLKG